MTLSAPDMRQFRDVIGHYPTGVVIVTGIDASGAPVGLVIGSFASASLDPPMVLFLPMKTSRTFAHLQTGSSYCINVLSADQEHLCRRFSGRTKQGNGFHGVGWHPAPSGAPILDGAVAWIDCTPHDLLDCGDHYIAVGAVQDLGVQSAKLPLLFFQSGYGRFARQSLVLSAVPDLVTSIRRAAAIRPVVEAVASEVGAECSVLAAIAGNSVFVDGVPAPGSVGPALGMHTPIVPPLATLFVGHPGAPDDVEWLSSLGGLAEDVVVDAARQLARARERGWSLMLHGVEHERAELESAVADFMAPSSTPASERRLHTLMREMSACHEPAELRDDATYDVLRISVPVHGDGGSVVLVLRLADLPRRAAGAQVRDWIRRLQCAADTAAQRIAATR